MDEILISQATNEQLIHKLKYCKSRGRQHIAELKELVVISDRIKRELNIRIVGLEVELKLAEMDRINSDDPFFDALLDLH